MSLHDTDVTVKSYFGQKKIMDDESQWLEVKKTFHSPNVPDAVAELRLEGEAVLIDQEEDQFLP